MQDTDKGEGASLSFVVADDDPLMRDAVQLTLKAEWSDAHVMAAENGVQATHFIREAATPVDVLVTDLIMPEQEGLETIRALRQSDPDLGIVAISGGFETPTGEVKILDMARYLGAHATVQKPFDSNALIVAVRKAMTARK